MNGRKILILIVLFVVFAEFRLVYLPGKKRVNSLNSLISTRISDKGTLEKLCREYETKKENGKRSALKIAGKNFSLFSYSGKLIEKHGIERSVSGIQPLTATETENFTIERIRLSLKTVTLKQLYDFLYEIEGAGSAVYMPEFRMRRDRENPHLLSAEIELIAIKTVNQ